MNLLERVSRHVRITQGNYRGLPSPPFLVLFVNSTCNMKCEHCFAWRSLNRRDDLSKEELFDLSRSMGRIENLNLSGGEPFLRRDLAEICRQFISQNWVGQIYVPTNGWYTERTTEQVSAILEEKGLELLVIELSLDGMEEFHDKLRSAPGAFERAMVTYESLAKIQERDPRLRVHANSTATNMNIEELRSLTRYLFDRCPRMDHHNLAIIRGDRRDKSLLAPDLRKYRALYRDIAAVWAPRETGRYGAIVEPMLQWAKLANLERQTQVTPCRAGRLVGVVYANGDVSACELRDPLGNLRDRPFPEIWNSRAACQIRKSIDAKECHCSTEVFLWPSIVFQPVPLIKALMGARSWRG